MPERCDARAGHLFVAIDSEGRLEWEGRRRVDTPSVGYGSCGGLSVDFGISLTGSHSCFNISRPCSKKSKMVNQKWGTSWPMLLSRVSSSEQASNLLSGESEWPRSCQRSCSPWKRTRLGLGYPIKVPELPPKYDEIGAYHRQYQMEGIQVGLASW